MPNHHANRPTLRHLALAAAAFGTLAVVGGLELPAASAHDLTGFSATPTCAYIGDDNATAQPVIDWTYTSSNSTGHTIVSFSFDRKTDAAAIGADQISVKARTREAVGPTSLRLTVTWNDGHVSSYLASTAVAPGICPEQVTTTIGTPTTLTPLPTTVPTTVPPVVESTPQLTAPPAEAATTTAPGAVVTPPREPSTTAQGRINLPETGSSSTVVVLAGVAALLVGAALLLAGRRGKAA